MKILMLTQWFQPESFYKGLPFATELMRRGHSVTVVTGFPNYPGGKVYPGYKIALLKRETMDGVEVIRVPLYPSHSNSIIGRSANYLSFSISAAVLGSIVPKRPDILYVYHPPASAGLAGIVLKKIHRVPMVYDIQDLWPDTLVATGMVRNGSILSIVNRLCRLIYNGASHITVLSPGFKAKLIERGVPSDKIDVIYNWINEEPFLNAPVSADPLVESVFSDRFNIVFAGNFGRAQGLDNVLAAASILLHSLPKIQFVFVGSGIDENRLKNETEKMRLTNVRFFPRRSTEQMRIIYKLADVLLVHLKDDPLFSITIPFKTQASLAAGKPVLMAVRGDASDLVRRANAGVCAEPGNPDALAVAVKVLYNMSLSQREKLGLNGQRFYRDELRMSIGMDKFENLFRTLFDRTKIVSK